MVSVLPVVCYVAAYRAGRRWL